MSIRISMYVKTGQLGRVQELTQDYEVVISGNVGVSGKNTKLYATVVHISKVKKVKSKVK
jgi:hypothetical protein